MSELKAKKYEVTEVNYHDLNKFVAHVLGLKSVELTLESSNDSHHLFDDIGNSKWSDEGEWQDAIDRVKKRHSCEYYSLGDVLNWLHWKGHIEAGHYLVHVSW